MEKKQKKKQPNSKSKIDEAEKLRRRLQSLFDKKQTNPKNKSSELKSKPTNEGADKKGADNKSKSRENNKTHKLGPLRANGNGQQQHERSGKKNAQPKNKNPMEPQIFNTKEQRKELRGKKGKNHVETTTASPQCNGVIEKNGTSQNKKSLKLDGANKMSARKHIRNETTRPVQQQQQKLSTKKQVNSNKRKASLPPAQTLKKKKTKLTPFQEVHNLDTSDDDRERQNTTGSAAECNDDDSSSTSIYARSNMAGFVGYSPPDDALGDNENDIIYEDNDRYFSSQYGHNFDEFCSDDDWSFENSDEEEEEEENYSDYDEDDYEEQEDSYDYSSDDMNDDMDFHSTDSDDLDYQLPDDVPEDLIIHQGTAAKRNLETNDNVTFDSDSEALQMIELKQQHFPVKIVKQPEAYERAELIKLSETVRESILTQTNCQVVRMPRNIITDDEIISNGTDCPQLIPIVDEEGFQLYSRELDEDSAESLGSGYEEVTDSDDDSLNEEDVNIKYLPDQVWGNTDDDEVYEYSDDETSNVTPVQMEADVIVAKNVAVLKSLSDNKENYESNSGSDVLLSDKLSKDFNASFKGAIITVNVENKLKEKKSQEASSLNLEDTVNQTTAVQDKKQVQLQPELDQTQSMSAAQNNSELSSSTSSTLTASRSVFCNAIDSNHVLVQLRDPIYIYGTVKLILIAGSVDVYGYTPRLGEELEIFSPRGLSTVEVKPKAQTHTARAHIDVELKRLQSYFAKAELQKLSETYVLQEDALIILKRNEQRKQLTNNFKKYMSENVFPNMNSIQMERPHYASEFLLRCIINTQSDKALRIPAQWLALKLEAQSRLMLIGGKAVGKSTLLRYLVNRNLEQHPRMLLIDLDIGQPELFVPQTISATLITQPLLGAGFMLNLQPNQAFAIGHSNIVLCPHLYMRAVRQLLHWCRTQVEYSHLPWLINTMGYNKGFGAELISVVCELLQLTDVVQLQSNKSINNFDYLMEPHVVAALQRNIYRDVEFQIDSDARLASYAYRLHVINSAVLQESRYQRDWDMSAKDMRYAIMLARLSDILVGSGKAEWLTDCRPLCTSLESLKIVNLFAGEYSREQLLKAIEANLVYLCHQKENSDVLQCLGIGIVRAIDHYVNQIYLLPAAPDNIMSNVNCLAIGEMPLPTSMFTNQGPRVKNIAPFVYNTIAANTSKSIKQIYHRPAAFLGDKQQT